MGIVMGCDNQWDSIGYYNQWDIHQNRIVGRVMGILWAMGNNGHNNL